MVTKVDGGSAPDEEQDEEEAAYLPPEHPKMDLVRRTQRGEEKARKALMEYWFHFGEGLLPKLLNRGIPEPDLRDMMVDALVKATEKAQRGQIRSNPDGAYINILRTKIYNHRTQDRRKLHLVDLAESGAPDGKGWWGFGSDDGQSELRSHIRLTFAAMGDKEWQMLLRTDRQGLSIKDAALELGLNPRSSERWVPRLRRRFIELFTGEKQETTP